MASDPATESRTQEAAKRQTEFLARELAKAQKRCAETPVPEDVDMESGVSDRQGELERRGAKRVAATPLEDLHGSAHEAKEAAKAEQGLPNFSAEEAGGDAR